MLTVEPMIVPLTVEAPLIWTMRLGATRKPLNCAAEDIDAGRAAILEFGRDAIRLGGSPLAEHGVGRSAVKQDLLRLLYGEPGIDEMRRVKRAIDPHGTLAPGVLFR